MVWVRTLRYCQFLIFSGKRNWFSVLRETCPYMYVRSDSECKLIKNARLAFTAPRELRSAGGSAAAQSLQAEPHLLPLQPRKLPAWWPPAADTHPRCSALALQRWPCCQRPHPARDAQQRFKKQQISRNTGSIFLISPRMPWSADEMLLFLQPR